MASSSDLPEPDFVDTPTNDIVPSFSFSGCGFLGVYHVGVATCLRDHTDVVNRQEIRFAGASAGALVATTFLCGIDFGEMTKLLLEVAEVVRDRENVDLGKLLRGVMDRYLPDDAHLRLRNRLYISVTLVNGFECGLITDFETKEHLIECLMASSFVPGFTGWVPPSLEAEYLVTSEKTHPAYLGTQKQKTEQNSKDEDGDCLTRIEKEKQKLQCSEKRSESVWDICPADNSSSGTYSKTTCTKEKTDSKNKSYLKMLVDLCFASLSTTSKVVRQMPMASQVINSVIPKDLNGVDEFFEAILMEIMSNKYMAFDGGFSDNLPSFDCNTITVSPFAGESDICPRDLTAMDMNFDLGNTSMQLSEDNVFRLSHALNPMEPAMLQKLCEEGYNACLRFLYHKDLLGCKKHLMTRAILSSSPCNIGHAHCTCSLCQASEAKIRSSLSCVNCQKAKQKALKSSLPAEVQLEFGKAINTYAKKSHESTFWTRLSSTLWWMVERMFSGTVKLADLALNFSTWLLRFMDNITCLAKYTLLPMGQKRKIVRSILASLRTSVTAPRNSRTQVPVSCSLNKLQPMCS